MTPEQKEKLLALFARNKLGVVSTVSAEGKPQSAVVAISETSELCLVFGSFKGNRKNNNIERNPAVSVVVGWSDDDSTTVQMEGKTQFLEGEERERLADAHCKKEDSYEYHKDPRQQYFKIIPTWIRYSDFSIDPQEIWELNF
ncbi:MAG TPA: pyridoxamine 5'-phosphate oxidase family protein [Candidatus Paceibacterota bacterium]|jgi:general stress protein 26|nr:pyridoxamine 5'-phosphate oxidase family protein [Candidatus Paceibacterota bacterium]